jgi:hypothetical protein
MHSCKAPTCSYSEAKRKCVKPNPYFEALSWCKRQGIHHTKCKKDYFEDKQGARQEACKRYEEKIHYVKPKKECPEGKVRNPKTGRCVKIKTEKKPSECPEGKVRNPKTGRCVKIRLSKRPIRPKRNYIHNNEIVLRTSSSVKTRPIASPDSFISAPNSMSMKSLSNFSSIKPISSTSKKSSKYSKVFKRQYKEMKNAKFVKKQKAFEQKPSSDPFKKNVPKDHVMKNLRLKKLIQRPFIKDVYDEKVKKIVEEQKKDYIQQSLHKSASSTSRKVKEMLHKIKATKIQKFLKSNLIKKYFTLDKRVQYFKYVRDFLKKINQKACLKPKDFKDSKGQVISGYTIDNIIDLEKQIGTKSAYGVIYRTSVKNMLGKAPIATKLSPINIQNKKEIDINVKISKGIVRPKLSRHFLLTYKAFECEKQDIHVPKIVMNTKYYITLNELAHGDLASLSENQHYLRNNDLVLNMATQALLSIMTFHSLGYIHYDCHWGNFLYHMTEDKTGYYHYKIYNKDYYLQNCGYTLMIYDFGMSEKSSKTKYLKNYTVNDYVRILSAFKNKADKGWCKPPNLVSPGISTFINNLQTEITRSPAYQNNHVDINNNVILKHLLQLPVKNIFVNVLPAGAKIINDSPYIIDETLAQHVK